jgi:hypothetical protein
VQHKIIPEWQHPLKPPAFLVRATIGRPLRTIFPFPRRNFELDFKLRLQSKRKLVRIDLLVYLLISGMLLREKVLPRYIFPFL